MKIILFIIPPVLPINKFINPPLHNATVITKKDGKLYGNMPTEPPLGCLSISSYLKSKINDLTTTLLDFNVVANELSSFTYTDYNIFFEDILKNITIVPHIICISSLFSTTYTSLMQISECCKKIFPNTLIVAGGGIPTNMYKDIYKNTINIDAICYGEGELPMLSLLQNNDFSDKAWITKEKLLQGFIPQYNFIENLDDIPLFDYDLIIQQQYLHNTASLQIGINENRYNIAYMSTRGCCHRCTFCASNSVHGQRVRQRSLSKMKEDFEYFKLKNISGIVFFDDNILFNVHRFEAIIKQLKELNLIPFFQGGLVMHSLTKNVLQLLKDTGVERNILSIESGNEYVLRNIMKKPLNHTIVKQVVADSNELGIYTTANILLGLPGETKEQIENSLEFLKTLKINWFQICNFNPLIGSPLYEVCINKGYITEQDFKNTGDYKTPIVNTEDFNADYINNKTYEFNLELNFIYNNDIKNGHYDTALIGFTNVIKRRPDHAMAHYFAAKCYKYKNNLDLYEKHIQICKQILQTDEFWIKYFKKYGIII